MTRTVLVVVSTTLLWAQRDPTAEARELMAKGTFQSAITLLGGVVKAMPGDADAHLLLGTALAQQGDRTSAIEHLLRAVQLRPESAAAYNSLGLALSRFVEMKAAREALETAVRLDPNFSGARVNLALVLAQQNDLPGALDQLDHAIWIEGDRPTAAYAHYLKGKVFSQQEAFDKAATELGRAVQLRPRFPEAWLALGFARRVNLDETGALQAFREAAALDPGDGAAQYHLGLEYLDTGDAHQAVVHLRESLRLHPDDKPTLYNLQRALRQDGQTDEAERIGVRVKELVARDESRNQNASEAVRLNNEGVETEKTGSLLLAIEKYRQALQLDPDHDGFRLNYGLALCRAGQWDQGISEIREVVHHHPDNAEATRALYLALDKQRAWKDDHSRSVKLAK